MAASWRARLSSKPRAPSARPGGAGGLSTGDPFPQPNSERECSEPQTSLPEGATGGLSTSVRLQRSQSVIARQHILLPTSGSGWSLTAEGAAVHDAERAAVIADVHLGYEWSRGKGGDTVPAHSLGETLAKLASLCEGRIIERLIVAGDLVESSTPCRRTAADVRALADWLSARHIDLVRLQGNHDPLSRPARATSIEVAGWTIAHGDRPVKGARTIIGHHHPALRANGIMAPCFVYSATSIVLPAFSPNAAGLDVTSRSLRRALRREGSRCAATLGGEIWDFGLIADLANRLERA
jgi:uncharacterized protein